MLLKCYFIFGLIFYLEAASISKEIPVNVVYLEPGDVRENAREKSHVRYLQNRNLDEKVQLSSRELKEADQHIPIPDALEKSDGNLIMKAKTLFLEKLTGFREQIDGLKLNNQKKPTAEDWAKLNEKLQEVFKKYEVNGLRQSQGGFFAEVSQATGQWFQNFLGNNNNPSGQEDEQPSNPLGQAWNNFTNNVSQAFSNIVNNNNNQESTTSNTVLGDTGVSSTTTTPLSFFSNLFSVFSNNQGNKPGQSEDTGATSAPNIFQGAFNNLINTLNPSTEKPANAQGDTGISSSTSAPGNQLLQNIGSVFGQAFGQSTRPPGVAGDNEVTRPPTFFQNFGQVLQTVFNNPNQASASPSADATTSAPSIINQGLQIPGQNGNNNIEQIQNTGQQIVQGFQNPQNFASQAQNIGQQISGNLSGGSTNNQIQEAAGVLQNPQNFASQAQNIGQQISGNLPSGSQNNQGIGQQISETFQNPQNFASQAQNVGQQIAGNWPPSTGDQGSSSQSPLNVDQLPFIGQQLSQNSQNPIQNIGEQFQAGNVINQIQSSTNQIQNPVVSNNNPLNLVDTQNQQLNINQLVIPPNALSGNGTNGLQSPVFANGISQLNPQTGSNNFVSAISNPTNAVSEFIQSNQQQTVEQTNEQKPVKPVTEENVEKIVSEKTKTTGEAEIMSALP